VPRNKSAELVLRDQEIVTAARRNIPRRDIAERYGISEGRVSQIITASLDPAFPDEDLRAWLQEGYFGDLAVLQEIKEGPGRAITSGKGDHIVDAVTGQPAYDPSPRIDAVRTAAQVRKNIATLMGSEKPAPKENEVLPEMAQAWAWAQDKSQENGQLRQDLEQLRAENEKLKARLSLLENAHPAEVVELSFTYMSRNPWASSANVAPLSLASAASMYPARLGTET
jgi:hypothetical protein